MSHEELTLTIDSTADTATVHCTGKLILTTASSLRREVKGLLPHMRVVTIDLTGVTMMDSVGLGMIAALYASARTAGRELHLVNVSPRIREMFSVTRVLSLFEPVGAGNVRMP